MYTRADSRLMNTTTRFSFNCINKDYEKNKNANFALYITFVEDVDNEEPGTVDNNHDEGILTKEMKLKMNLHQCCHLR